MEDGMKGFWKFFAVLMAGAVINLAGGIIGKTLLGYLLFAAGLIIVLAVFVFLFMKKSYFKDGHLKVLILALIMSALLTSSVVLLMNGSGARRAASSNSSLSMLSRMTGQSTGGAGQFTRSNGGGGFSGNFGNGGNSVRNNGGFSGGNGFSQNGGTGSSGFGPSSTTGTTSAPANNFSTQLLLNTIFGWLFLVAGAITLLVFVIRLLTKKTTYTGSRLQVLILGLLIGAMLGASTSMLVARQMRRFPGNFNGTMPSGFQSGTRIAGQGSATAVLTATAAPTETPTPTFSPADIAATATAMAPQPTSTSTPVVVSNLVVCLDYNRQVGETIYTSPSLNGTPVGVVPAADCFTVDGKNSQYPGWYHLAKGQNGMGGINFSTDENTHQLWVNGTHFMTTAVSLTELPELAVTK